MYKIRQYFSTLEITRGFFIALSGSLFIYLHHFNLSYTIINTILALSSLFLLLQSEKKIWFWYGFFIGFLWFWWISLSLQHYGYSWAFLVGIFFISLIYGFIYYVICLLSEKIAISSSIPSVFFKILLLLGLSYIHPFSFDWLKPELIFVESYIGIKKWQFAIVLFALAFSIWKKKLSYLALIVLAYQPTFDIKNINSQETLNNICLVNTHTSVKDKWDDKLHAKQFKHLFNIIDQAIEENKSLIILPESVFPVFLNHSEELLQKLSRKSKHISIVTGGLHWDGTKPHNSTYIFTDNKITIANKVVLVPFGESNPLPNFLSKLVNKIFYDGAVDYVASKNVVDYQIDGITYRNAICFEATSEKLYKKGTNGKAPQNMIIISNNGWFTPSIEPTLQKLLLLYYHKKYGTNFYHSANMSDSYVIK